MKKIYSFIIMLIIGLCIFANPIALPVITISELFFDETGNWKLELDYMDPEELTFDSIFLYSSTDTVKVPDNAIAFKILILPKDTVKVNIAYIVSARKLLFFRCA